jgi:hypothetical protein
MKGLDLHRSFFNECGKPLLMQAFPEEFPLLAVASVGCGSDRLGADNKVSRDHCWEPGLQIFSHRLPRERLTEIESYVFEHLPWEHAGYKRGDSRGSPNGIRAWTVDEFFSSFTSFATPPARDRQWLLIADVDLYHVTNGEVFHDPTGDLTRRRQAFGYYPDNVWRFKLAGRACRIGGQRLEMERCIAHGEDMAADLMLHEGLREVFHFVCLINRRYACHDKWLPWLVRRLPVLAEVVDPLVAQIHGAADVRSRLTHFAELVTVLADYVYDNGLATRGEYWWSDLPGRNPWAFDLRETITGELKELAEADPHWIGVENRYGSGFGIGDFRKLLTAEG